MNNRIIAPFVVLRIVVLTAMVICPFMQAKALPPKGDNYHPTVNSGGRDGGSKGDKTKYPDCHITNGGPGCTPNQLPDFQLPPKKPVPIVLPDDRPDGGIPDEPVRRGPRK
jgi:hypothetical protein